MKSTQTAAEVDSQSAIDPITDVKSRLGIAAPIELSPDAGEHPAEPARATDRRFVVAALMLIMVLASMEMTVTSTAMPTIIGELKGLEHYSWVASLYLLAATVTMPLYGRLADVLGRKRVVIGATLLFTIGSVLSAFSHTMIELIIFRGLQGLGAGGIMPVVLTIIGDLFTLEERAKIQGLFSSVWGLSSLFGPALGAFLIHTLGWRWVFLVNLPFGVLGLVVLLWKYHDKQKPHSTALDLPGIALLALGSLALLALVSRLGPDGWSTQMAVGLGALALIAIAVFIFNERRTANPIMPPALMMHRAIGPSILATFFFGGVFLSLDTYVPLYVQGGRGGGATAAAAVVTPVMMTWALSNMLSARLLIRWGFRITAMIGAALVVAGMIGLLAGAYFVFPRWVLTIILSVTGFGFGWSSMCYLLAAQNAVDWQQRGIVTSSVSFFRTMGGAVGIGILGAVFNSLSHDELAGFTANNASPAAALDPHLAANLDSSVLAQIQHVIASNLIWVFVAMLGSAVVMFFVTLLMPKHKAREAAIPNAVPAMD